MLNTLRRRARSGQMETPSEFQPCPILEQERFLKALHLEQKRTERSRRPFVLMLLESSAPMAGAVAEELLERVVGTLATAKRETDELGWYRHGSVLGIIFTEIAASEGRSIAKVLRAKIGDALSQALDNRDFSQFKLSFHVFPEDWQDHDPTDSAGSTRQQELLRESDPKTLASLVKTSMDFMGSLCGLAILSPLLVTLALAVKLTSKGPIFFRQQRVGQFGRPFTFLKLRSMYTANNHAVHQDYVKQFIAGANNGVQPVNGNKTTYKLTNDPRITPLGRFLRKTSLDELPQLINVLRGEMSLVGPRPPIPYEVEYYDIWHKRRFLAVKPGITGLWQVNGRSRTTFDEMVRLDLKYAKCWSLALDIKILLQTPRAIFSGEGAY